MKNLKIMIFIFLAGIITGLILSLWLQIGQREHRRKLEAYHEQSR